LGAIRAFLSISNASTSFGHQRAAHPSITGSLTVHFAPLKRCLKVSKQRAAKEFVDVALKRIARFHV
jgi:hypothetical protein